LLRVLILLLLLLLFFPSNAGLKALIIVVGRGGGITLHIAPGEGRRSLLLVAHSRLSVHEMRFV
jgi:hypothetical protein